ncbi:MAG: NAD(P)H-hydrate dehydratase [Spirochaetia bacterium]|nr:NAD(P)H-hydrate dehydratase [Spirochaetia bacterium]
MRNIYGDTRILDKNALIKYSLTEDILMENAALALEKEVRHQLKDIRNSGRLQVLIITGCGNNGGDGMALARRLAGTVDSKVLTAETPLSPQCILQQKRALAAGVIFTDRFEDADIIVDCLYGSGFHKPLSTAAGTLIEKANSSDSIRIACDIPSGIDRNGEIDSTAFMADCTVTMGALKMQLFGDRGKDFTGKIKTADLGISRQLFEDDMQPDAFMLEKSDLKLPVRESQNTNKGTYGHAAIAIGEKTGAAVIAGTAAFAFGAGLVTLVCQNGMLPDNIPFHLMSSNRFPDNTTAIAVGMGLGTPSLELLEWLETHNETPAVFDADLFRFYDIEKLIKSRKNLVMTPHPKEFASLLELCRMGTYTVNQIQEQRFKLAREFCMAHPDTVLVLKGANTIIGLNDELYINPLGCGCLSKGGSGDVLAGLIASLLAQGWNPFQAAIHGSLAHAMASRKIRCSYGMDPFELIEKVKKL